MFEDVLDKYLPILIHIFELMGIIVLTFGTFTAFYHYFVSKFKDNDINVKSEFADVMITALDFKLAAEILKTVIVRNRDELLLLAAIFILRVIMTFVLEREINLESKLDNKKVE